MARESDNIPYDIGGLFGFLVPSVLRLAGFAEERLPATSAAAT
jgi:hypothetical protein